MTRLTYSIDIVNISPNMTLEFSAAAFKLPCANNCPFRLACPEKYEDGTCVEKIDSYVAENIYGKPSPKIIVRGKLTFTTTNPSGKISISNGFASVLR